LADASGAIIDTALLQQIELNKQAGPSRHDLQLLREWLISSKGNNGDLRGPGFDIWKEGDEKEEGRKKEDFIVLNARHEGRGGLGCCIGYLGV